VNHSRAPLLILAGAGQIREDLPHQFRAYGEEVSAVLPRKIPQVHQPQVDFVNQGCGLENVPGRLLCHIAVRKARWVHSSISSMANFCPTYVASKIGPAPQQSRR